MKRCLVGLVILGLLVPMLALAAVEIPAPFAKAREIAMAAGPDSSGRCLAIFEWNENGTDFAYILGYMPNYNLIGIGSLVEGWVVEFNIETGEFTVWTPMGRFPVSKEEIPMIFEKAFEVFRALVGKDLI